MRRISPPRLFRPGRNVQVRPSIIHRRPLSLWTRTLSSSTPSYTRTTLLYLRYITGAFLFAHLFVDYFYELSFTYGISMLPTLPSSGGGVLVSKTYRHGRGVQVGDLVSYVHPLKHEGRAIKRVLGMAGDFVLRDSPDRGKVMIQVPKGHCYVVGDNCEWSRDSRMFGPLPLNLVKGKVVKRLEWWSWVPYLVEVEEGQGLRDARVEDWGPV